MVKGQFSPNNNVDWVSRKQFYKPNSKHLNRLCTFVYVALSGWNSARICDITRGQLSIDSVHRFSQFFFFSWISIVLLIKFIHKCMHIHLSPNIPKYKMFMKSKILFKKIMYSSIRQLYCCDITDIRRVPPERATYRNLMKPLKNHISWLDYQNLPKLLPLGF